MIYKGLSTSIKNVILYISGLDFQTCKQGFWHLRINFICYDKMYHFLGSHSLHIDRY